MLEIGCTIELGGPHYSFSGVSTLFVQTVLNFHMKIVPICPLASSTRVETLIVATIYLQMIQNRYMFRSFTVLQCSHQHCVQPVASDVEVVGYL